MFEFDTGPLIGLAAIVVAVLLVLALVRSITRAYVKTPANRSFVRTGGLFRKPNGSQNILLGRVG